MYSNVFLLYKVKRTLEKNKAKMGEKKPKHTSGRVEKLKEFA